MRILLLFMLFLSACSLPHEPGPMPADIIETEFSPMLNVFGVLRNDGQAGSSFFHVERFVTTGEMYSFTVDVLIRNATVELNRTGSDSVWTFAHVPDSMYHGYYYHETFRPVAGAEYMLFVSADGYPDVTGTCKVPQIPQIESLDINSAERRFQARLSGDSLTAEYQIAALFESSKETFYFRGDEYADISLTWKKDETPQFWQISAVDENLRSYRLASPSIMPQSYHEDGSTVTGGLGVFGAVGITLFQNQ